MIVADDFLGPARERWFDFFTGVPCSFLTPVINRVISDRVLDYVGAASEGEAVAIASGAWLAGRRTVVMCQNSGLGNTVNPLTSLNFPFRIPTLMIVTWRGQPGLADEPQHELMGQITGGLLDVMRIPNAPFPSDAGDAAAALDAAQALMAETGLPFAFIMAKDSVADEVLNEPALSPWPKPAVVNLRGQGGNARPPRIEMLERLLEIAPDEAGIIASTGKGGRELFTLADRPQHLYQVGSMGCAAGMGLGVALNNRRPIIVLDGDGAALMKMGTIATIGAQAPQNLIHIVLDNGVHDSTGGQGTVSANVEFADIAAACGYGGALKCDTAAGFAQALETALSSPGPHMIHARVEPGSIEQLGRPTVSPSDVARRFRDFLSD